MSEFQKVKIGDFLTLDRNNTIEIFDNEFYQISGVQNHGKGIVVRRRIQGKELRMKKYQVIKENQLMWCKVDTKNGAFGVTKKEHEGTLVSTNMALANIDTKKYLPEFLERLFQISSFSGNISHLSSGSTNRKYLTPKQLFELVEVPNLTIEKQLKFIEKLNRYEKSGFKESIIFQQSHLTSLRQQILQDAISGKLTADWREENPDIEPASKLLEKIKAEKEKLIAEKKIKKEKPLSKISADEVPFELPEGWEWCRLGEITEIIMGQSPSGDTYNKKGIGIPFFQGKKEFGDIYPIGNSTWCSEPKRLSIIDDILISVRAPVGDVNVSDKEYAIGRGLSLIRDFSKENLNYWFLFYFLRAEQKNWKKKGSFFDSINRNVIEERIFPLPPLTEQKVIVYKIEKIMEHISKLEEKTKQNKQDAEMLMQSFLVEAFKN